MAIHKIQLYFFIIAIALVLALKFDFNKKIQTIVSGGLLCMHISVRFLKCLLMIIHEIVINLRCFAFYA